jgi:hypothetical protein
MSKPDGSTSKPLQLRIFEKLRVSEDLALWEVSGLPRNARSHLSKVPLQGFWKIPAALCDGFPQSRPVPLPGFDIFLCNWWIKTLEKEDDP